jgi:hypothetical protein
MKIYNYDTKPTDRNEMLEGDWYQSPNGIWYRWINGMWRQIPGGNVNTPPSQY